MSGSLEVLLRQWQDARNFAAPLRYAVFVEEQGVPEELEWDELDAVATHAIAICQGLCIGTGRLLPAGETGCASVGRMAVRLDWRSKGIGSLLLRTLLKEARRLEIGEIVLHAQTSAIGFYRRFGFIAGGPEFQEAGIAHVEMRLALDSIPKEWWISPSTSPLRW